MTSASELHVKSGDDVEELLFSLGCTDGLPVVPPTRSRVKRMLRGTSMSSGDVLGRCPPSYAEVTVERLAIVAVMAGCTPEMFRIVVAGTKAMLQPEFGLHGVSATTMGATPIVVVNGPCRDVAGVNYKHGACGSGSRATSIGRSLKLLIQNVGRSKLGGTESTTIGTPMKFGMCFGEWEERCGMWDPLAVARGSAERNEDAVTVMAATSGPVQLVDTGASGKQLVEFIAKHLASAYAAHAPLVNYCLLVVSPEHYDTLVRAGMNSKAQLAQELWRQTSRHLVPHFPYIFETLRRLRAPYMPSILFKFIGVVVATLGRIMNLAGRPLTIVPKFTAPASFQVVVAGGEAGKYTSFMPGFGIGRPPMSMAEMSRPVTARVEPRPASLDASPDASGMGDEVLDPRPPAPKTLLRLAERTGMVKGPVALMDISKPRGSELLDVIERRLQGMDVETRRYRKPTFSRPCPDDLQRAITSECKSAILGLAD